MIPKRLLLLIFDSEVVKHLTLTAIIHNVTE